MSQSRRAHSGPGLSTGSRLVGCVDKARVLRAAVCLFAGVVLIAGCGPTIDSVAPLPPDPARPSDDLAIVTFCSGCHAMPNPQTFVRGRWRQEVAKMIEIYRQSGKTDLVLPDFEATVGWFEKAAGETIAFDDFAGVPIGSDLFERLRVPIRRDATPDVVTAISHASEIASESALPKFVIADMDSGRIQFAQVTDDALELSEIGQVAHPAHVEPSDLDRDGEPDYLVADLGDFFPEPRKHGSLWWFRRTDAGRGPWQRVPLMMGMMRVSDLRPADFDGDGDIDLVVSEFGLYRHGGIYLLENTGFQDRIPQFKRIRLDDRPGAIHLPVIDLNRDGHPDFVALISQQHESVVAFLNRGDATFSKEVIYEAADPAYGSSGIEMVDMDGDGDSDVLMSNGDTFDDQLPKPIHSIQWLENRGEFPYTHHRIGQLPGAYRAVAGDIDGDGDIDVAAVSLLIGVNVDQYPPATFDAVTVFQQTDEGRFRRHRLEVDRCEAATCNLSDWDSDGNLDVVVFPYSTLLTPSDAVTVFRFKGGE